MKPPIWIALLGLLLAVPNAFAAPGGAAVERVTITLVHDELSIVVWERRDFVVTDPSAYQSNANWTAWIRTGDTFRAELSKGGLEKPVDVQRINATGRQAPGFQEYRLDLGGLFANVQAQDRFSLLVSYDTDAPTYGHRTADAAPTLVVFAQPAPGYAPMGTGVGPFVLSGERYHAQLNAVSPDRVLSVQFSQATGPAGGSTGNLDSYFWGGGGLVVGLLLATWAARRGWLGTPPPKRFEKGGQMEPREMLDARRRTLMAALKELELAHEAKEIPDAAYAPLKEEYKAQAVKVMRSLEEKEPPAS